MRRKSFAAWEAAKVLKVMTLGAGTSSIYRLRFRWCGSRDSYWSFDAEMSLLQRRQPVCGSTRRMFVRMSVTSPVSVSTSMRVPSWMPGMRYG